MSDALKPCPFCESQVQVVHWEDRIKFSWQVECLYCGIFGPLGKTEVDAVEKWNRLPRKLDIERLA